MNEPSGHTELLDPRQELAELTSATLTLVQWYADAGAFGLPVEDNVDAVLASITVATAGARPASAQRPVLAPALADGAPLSAASLEPAGAPEGRTNPAALAALSRPTAKAQPPFSRPQLAASAFGSAAMPATSAGTAAGMPEAHPRGPTAARPAAPPSPALSSPEAAASSSPVEGAMRAAVAARSAAANVVSAGSSQASPDERRMRLALLAEEARACTRCRLHEQRKQAVFARGNPFAELCFVGEGPGADEDAFGEPFVGAAGQLLDKMISAMGYRRDDVYICNIVKCRPPKNRKPEPDEMAACSPFFTAQLDLIKPKVIVALGGTAMQGLIGTSEGITRLRGKWKLYKGATPIMPTFHPAYLLRNTAAKREVWADLQEVMRHLGKGPALKE